MPATVNTTHKDYGLYSPKWKRARDCVSGQDAIHMAAEAYLPKLKDEKPNDYKGRIRRSDFFNGTFRTIDGLGGMAFRKAPTVTVPTAIDPYLKDINMAGAPMDALAAEIVEEVLSVGRIGILVDHPTPPQSEDGKVVSITVAAAEKFGLRPTLQLYTAESIINWRFARINNAWMLSQVVLKECEQVPDGEFKQKEEDRYRVLDLDGAGQYRQRMFKINDKGDDEQIGADVYPMMAGKTLDFIPFAIVGTGGRGDIIDEPPLIDLIDANLALYQMNAIYRHTLYFCPPTFFISGYTINEGEKISVGGTAALVFPNVQATAGYAEPQGTMLPALRDAMNDKKQEMAVLGARMIADETKQVETLGATQIKRAGENSVLAKIVQAVSGSLEWALGIFAEWAGQKGEIVYQINKDFLPTMIDAQTLTALVGAVQAGQLSSESFFDLIQRGDIVKADLTFEEEQGRIDASGPARPDPTKPTSTGNPVDPKAAAA